MMLREIHKRVARLEAQITGHVDGLFTYIVEYDSDGGPSRVRSKWQQTTGDLPVIICMPKPLEIDE